MINPKYINFLLMCASFGFIMNGVLGAAYGVLVTTLLAFGVGFADALQKKDPLEKARDEVRRFSNKYDK